MLTRPRPEFKGAWLFGIFPTPSCMFHPVYTRCNGHAVLIGLCSSAEHDFHIFYQGIFYNFYCEVARTARYEAGFYIQEAILR